MKGRSRDEAVEGHEATVTSQDDGVVRGERQRLVLKPSGTHVDASGEIFGVRPGDVGGAETVRTHGFIGLGLRDWRGDEGRNCHSRGAARGVARERTFFMRTSGQFEQATRQH